MQARKALIISADAFEDSELLYPLYRLREAGFVVERQPGFADKRQMLVGRRA